MSGTLIGYARCSIDVQDLTVQRQRPAELGVAEDRIYLDHGRSVRTASASDSTRRSQRSRPVHTHGAEARPARPFPAIFSTTDFYITGRRWQRGHQ
jgi:hypothetical protein